MSQIKDDDVPQLSAETFLALQEFYNEQNIKEIQIQSNTIVEFDEDWQLSQFWYDNKTVNTLVKAALQRITYPNNKIALISCPTLFNRFNEESTYVRLFEYDKRFLKLCGTRFIQYDYKFPLNIPKEFSNYFDLVIADPPFLSEDCLTKTAITVKFLAKQDIILCTGEIMSGLADRLLGVKKCNFQPSHKNNLANEFCCYANFNLDDLIL